ncbi:MAG: response regulator, partial [Candidatus Margulisiibacteriota bacterium]
MTNKIGRVLVVEDEADVRSGICEILKGLYSVHEAASGEEAVKAAEGLFPYLTLGIVLLDIKLPDMSGLEVLKKILEENPLLTVIMVTAMKDTKFAVEAMSEGASDYITKPFTSEVLLSKLKFAEEKGYLGQQFDLIYHKLDRWRADVDSRLLEAKHSKDHSDVIRNGKAGTYEEIEKQIKEKLNKEIKIEVKIPKILVVDDEDDMRSAITEIVKEKYEVESASSAGAAIALVKNKSFDLALLDIRLPDMSGLDLLKEIK